MHVLISVTTRCRKALLKRMSGINFFRSDVQSVLNLPGDAELRLEAPVSDHLIEGGMNVVGQTGAGIVVRLTKKANL